MGNTGNNLLIAITMGLMKSDVWLVKCPLQHMLSSGVCLFVCFFNQILVPMNKRKGSRRNCLNLNNSLWVVILFLFLGLCAQHSAWRNREYLPYLQGVFIWVFSWQLVLVQLSSIWYARQTATSREQSFYPSSDTEAGDKKRKRHFAFNFMLMVVETRNCPKWKNYYYTVGDPC